MDWIPGLIKNRIIFSGFSQLKRCLSSRILGKSHGPSLLRPPNILLCFLMKRVRRTLPKVSRVTRLSLSPMFSEPFHLNGREFVTIHFSSDVILAGIWYSCVRKRNVAAKESLTRALLRPPPHQRDFRFNLDGGEKRGGGGGRGRHLVVGGDSEAAATGFLLRLTLMYSLENLLAKLSFILRQYFE